MSEAAAVLEEMIREVEAGRSCALCAVVGTKGSTPQAAGAALMIREDGSTVGTLGGGCVEAEIVRRAFKEVIPASEPTLMSFVLNHDWGWDDGLICGGRMDVGVMPVTALSDLAPHARALEAHRAGLPASFPVVVQREGRLEEYRVKLEVPPVALIAGAGHVGQALARMGVELGFRVVVIDDRADCASPDRFGPQVELIVEDISRALEAYPIGENCYVVIVTRGHQNDQRALEAVIHRPARYIGLIGSRRKRNLIFADMKKRGVSRELLDRVHSPVGLAIGAVTVPEIAVSIAAELVQVRRERKPMLVEGPFETPAVAETAPIAQGGD